MSAIERMLESMEHGIEGFDELQNPTETAGYLAPLAKSRVQQ